MDSAKIRPTSSARVKSAMSIMRRGPTTEASQPPQSPSTAIPTNSAASTAPMRAGEPVEISTSQGSATAVISVPAVEITSATSRPVNERRTRED